MAVSNSAGGKKFYSVVAGKFRCKVPEGTEGAEKRENKNGKIVHELCFDTMKGTIVDIAIEDSEYGQNLNITFNDGDVLSLIFDSNIGQTFAKILPNIKEGEYLEMNTWIDKEEKTAFVVKQNGQALPWAFTKDNPNGIPQATKKTVAGRDKWDFSEITNFLYDVVTKEAQRFSGDVVPSEFQPEEQVETEKESVEIEDIPF